MDVDFSVEIGADCEALEFPWADAESGLRYYDLRNQPDLLLYVDEANQYPELSHFLSTANSGSSEFISAKCDVWLDRELSPAEEIYEASLKLASYVDLVFANESLAEDAPRFSFEYHETIAGRLVELLNLVPEIAASAEFIIRQCFFHSAEEPVRPGFYYTFYLFGYGQDEAETRKHWGIGLDLVKNAIGQVSAEIRRGKF